ncbi:MAG TPA: HNH endonuclease [Propionibacteriaceae bacterium]|nr:HNH endonuclease [Propionibacteriaceae bacterium]
MLRPGIVELRHRPPRVDRAQAGLRSLRVLRRDRSATAAGLCAGPIAGGRYTIDNVVPACRSCNTSKCSDEVTVWLRRRRLDERAFLLRHLGIMTAFAQQLPS